MSMMLIMLAAKAIKVNTKRLTKNTDHTSREIYLKRVSLNLNFLSSGYLEKMILSIP